jgi:hypothetical protein
MRRGLLSVNPKRRHELAGHAAPLRKGWRDAVAGPAHELLELPFFLSQYYANPKKIASSRPRSPADGKVEKGVANKTILYTPSVSWETAQDIAAIQAPTGVEKNTTPSLTQKQAIALLEAIPTDTLQGRRADQPPGRCRAGAGGLAADSHRPPQSFPKLLPVHPLQTHAMPCKCAVSFTSSVAGRISG